MDLGKAVSRFSSNPISKYDFSTGFWVDTGVKGSLPSYDRFVSDRAFGQVKRNLLTPWDQKLDMASQPGVFKIAGVDSVFAIESLNEDTQNGTRYNNIYMIHELDYPCKVKKNVGVKRASGVSKKDVPVVLATTWGDYSRYSASNSREFPVVDYTIINLFLPRGTPIDTDCYVEMDNQIFDVEEISYSLNIMVCRAKQRGGNFIEVSEQGSLCIRNFTNTQEGLEAFLALIDSQPPHEVIVGAETSTQFASGSSYGCPIYVYRVDGPVAGYTLSTGLSNTGDSAATPSPVLSHLATTVHGPGKGSTPVAPGGGSTADVDGLVTDLEEYWYVVVLPKADGLEYSWDISFDISPTP